MRAVLVLVLAVLLAAMASAAPVDPAEAWRPMRPFMGTWKGTRAGTGGPVKVTRVYAPSPTNHHLEITEKGGGSRAAVLAMVSLDPQRQVLVLRQFAADGSVSDAALDPAASTGNEIVFASPESDTARTRIIYVRTGARNFVERVEHAAGGERLVVVSETRFVRSD